MFPARQSGIEQELIVSIISLSDLEPGAAIEAVDAILSPGLFDVQVNGGEGVMLNNDPTRESKMCRCIQALSRMCAPG